MADTLPIVTLGEAQAFVRIETGEEEAVVAGLVRTASALCEAFLGQVVVARPFAEVLPARQAWVRLRTAPVRTIENVAAIAADGAELPLAPGEFAIDVDAEGSGWVRLTNGLDASRVKVSGTAGMAMSQNEVPEPIRQGVLRLVGHLFASRDGPGGAPPAAVTALWRPFRRVRLA